MRRVVYPHGLGTGGRCGALHLGIVQEALRRTARAPLDAEALGPPARRLALPAGHGAEDPGASRIVSVVGLLALRAKLLLVHVMAGAWWESVPQAG